VGADSNSVRHRAGTNVVLLIRLFQQTAIGSMNGCLDRDFAKACGSFNRSLLPKKHTNSILAGCRWPDGFASPKCGNRRAYESANLRRWQCADCQHQVSRTAGTILHNTKKPLTVWFWAAYLMTIDKRGLPALLPQRQLGLSRHETA
jgi:hypothetical protein